MQRRLLNWLKQTALAFATVAVATLLTILLFLFHVPILPRIAPFLFLIGVLFCSWRASYVGAITSVIFTVLISNILTHRTFDLTQIDLYRLFLILLLSTAVSWIENHRRHVEAELRRGVEQKTVELKAAVENLEREVHERKIAEQEVRRLNQMLEARVDERTRQLEISNRELESFSYSVSHDLRAPLRSIDGFSRILLTNCYDKFDDEEKGLFQRILAATGRMNELIDDLLNLARVTRTAMRTMPVDLSSLVEQIASEIRKEHPESRTEFLIEPGLSAPCDTGLIEVALTNLLENAWKFSSQTPSPRVQFGSMSMDGERVLFVKDNGAGFDPAYMSKLFSPFQRLHRQEEFPGTGVGLATVSRIVQRHGGWIKAESEVGQGAIFFFTLSNSLSHHLPEDPKPPLPRLESPSSASSQSTLM